jgi:hypothetical protein
LEVQFREFLIAKGELNHFIAAWRAGVVPLRKRAGFEILEAWVDEPNDRFCWLLAYSGSDGFQAADDRYYSSSARQELHPDPADLIVSTHAYMVRRVTP